MGAAGVVQTVIRDQQIVEDFSSLDRPGDDARHIFERDSAVPDPLRIDDDGRAMLALVKTAGVIGAGERAQPRFLQLNLEGVLERLMAIRITATPFMARLSHISAYKNVVMKSSHVRSMCFDASWLSPSRRVRSSFRV
jgi:hypothetical protein